MDAWVTEAGDISELETLGGLRTPFAEAWSPASAPLPHHAEAPRALQIPFADHEQDDQFDEATDLLESMLAELHDEDFNESLAELAEETEQATDDRFQGEGAFDPDQREAFARSYLSPVQFEADQYLATLESGMSGTDPATLSEDGFDALLDRFDPQAGDLTPASEEFIGKLVKKAKRVVRKVASVARQAGKLAMPLLAPILKKLRKLVRPLLERVLRFAIGRLPEPLRPAARALADKILGKTAPANGMSKADDGMAQAAPTDTEALADSFDFSLAEALVWPGAVDNEEDAFGSERFESIGEHLEIERLAAARNTFTDRLEHARQGDDLAPAIEQFVPVVLAALRTGIGLVGRPKVVSLLSGYLAKMIAGWVGPQGSMPLARAIVDTGLRMATLEAEADTVAGQDRFAPALLADIVEDSVRRLAEAEDYLFEDEDLTQVAIADAFGEAAATFLPQDLVRDELQLAPTLGGAFVSRRAGHPRSYAKYSHTPEVTVSARAADSLSSFGSTTLGAAVRAAGGSFPLRARMHVYQALPGSSAGSMVRHDRRGASAKNDIHPLSRRAAAVLLREPGLGVRAPARFLRSRNRIAAGQRLFVLEPLDQTITVPNQPGRRISPARMWLAVNARKKRITLGFYLSEPESQAIAKALRAGKGHAELLRQIVSKFRSIAQQRQEGEDVTAGLSHEDGEAFEDYAARVARHMPGNFRNILRERIGTWALPALAAWMRGNAAAFQQAADHPDPGVRLRVRLNNVPGLDGATSGGLAPSLAAFTAALKGKPDVSISVSSGLGRK